MPLPEQGEILTEKVIRSLMTRGIGCSKSLALFLGVYPLKKGWIQRLVGEPLESMEICDKYGNTIESGDDYRKPHKRGCPTNGSGKSKKPRKPKVRSGGGFMLPKIPPPHDESGDGIPSVRRSSHALFSATENSTS